MKILISGPSKCGKSTLAKAMFEGFPSGSQFLEDLSPHAEKTLTEPHTDNWIVCVNDIALVPVAVRVSAHIVFVYAGSDDGPQWKAVRHAT